MYDLFRIRVVYPDSGVRACDWRGQSRFQRVGTDRLTKVLVGNLPREERRTASILPQLLP